LNGGVIMRAEWLSLLAATCLVLSCLACGSSNVKEDYKQIADADERMVASCTFLGEVDGEGTGSGAAWLQGAKNKAINAAGAMGATHIVWRTLDPGGAGRAFASGRAYKCPVAAPPPAQPGPTASR
jgi:hypothetical protein